MSGLVAADRIYAGSPDRRRSFALSEVEGHENSYVQEHVALLESILHGKRINEGSTLATSTLMAIMGRISAYTGQRVTWKEMLRSDFQCRPSAADFEEGRVICRRKRRRFREVYTLERLANDTKSERPALAP